MPAQNLAGLVLDRAHPLARGLVGWWPMNEGGGTRVNDISGNQLAGTMANFSMSQSSGWVGSSVGRGVAFDATDDALTIAHNVAIANALTSTTFTFAAWARVDNLAAYSLLAYKGNAGGIPGPLQVYWEPSGGGAWWFLIGDGTSSSGGPNSAAGQISAGVWHHVACVRNGSTGYIYINGKLSGTPGGGFIGPNDVSTSLCLGCRTGSYISQGATTQARLYSRALSAVEAAQLYADPLAGALSRRRYYVPAAPVIPATVKWQDASLAGFPNRTATTGQLSGWPKATTPIGSMSAWPKRKAL